MVRKQDTVAQIFGPEFDFVPAVFGKLDVAVKLAQIRTRAHRVAYVANNKLDQRIHVGQRYIEPAEEGQLIALLVGDEGNGAKEDNSHHDKVLYHKHRDVKEHRARVHFNCFQSARGPGNLVDRPASDNR